jgi:signal recognition particle GTPase
MNVKKVLPITLDSLLSSPNPRQLESIKHTQAPQLILAGAGTGKTTTITAKIAYMVEKENIAPLRYSPSPSPKKPQGTCAKK